MQPCLLSGPAKLKTVIAMTIVLIYNYTTPEKMYHNNMTLHRFIDRRSDIMMIIMNTLQK